LPDHMEIRGPIALEGLAFDIGIANGGDVVRQGIQPHVHDVIGITWNRNAPAEGRAADREIAQASLYKGDNLVAPTVRPDENGVRFIESQQAILPGGQTEEIGGLLSPLYCCAGRDR